MIGNIVQAQQIAQVRSQVLAARKQGKRVGFVATMGFLHAGHASLVAKARESCDYVVMSIFVNPLQFGPNEDFINYPRDIERDKKVAADAGVDLLFTPSVEEMYPQKILTNISVTQVSEPLCG